MLAERRHFDIGTYVSTFSLARYGYSFRVLSEELRADKEVALLALRKHGHALYWASEELQADKEV
jgi:hypothetical protein